MDSMGDFALALDDIFIDDVFIDDMMILAVDDIIVGIEWGLAMA